MNNVVVNYRDRYNGNIVEDDEIGRIFVILDNPEFFVVEIETKTKYPFIETYGSNSCSFYTKKNNLAYVKINGFDHSDEGLNHIICNPKRYGMHIVFFHECAEKMEIIYEKI
jgi:hypothetical protein